MTKVRLDDNKEIGDEGTKALAEALKVNATVKDLNLAGCGIGDNGAAALAEALRSNSNTLLTELWLQGNHDIGEHGKHSCCARRGRGSGGAIVSRIGRVMFFTRKVQVKTTLFKAILCIPGHSTGGCPTKIL